MLVVAVLHAPLLRLAVSPFVADDNRAADHLFVYSGDGRFARAAEAYRNGEAKQVLVLDRPASRLVRLGIVASRADECRRELTRRGVPGDAIVLISGTADNPWQAVHCLGAWLKDHPGESVRMLCDRFASGDLRYVMSRVLGANERQRVAIQALADRRYDESNWWKSRWGWHAAMGATCELAYDRLRGEDPRPGPEFDIEAFERTLR
ncbi:MAG TPA: hypothetical protein VG826_13070 [Pirellulales bacterium]|nr:hypothetical protein [Pirellulales bacterium]